MKRRPAPLWESPQLDPGARADEVTLLDTEPVSTSTSSSDRIVTNANPWFRRLAAIAGCVLALVLVMSGRGDSADPVDEVAEPAADEIAEEGPPDSTPGTSAPTRIDPQPGSQLTWQRVELPSRVQTIGPIDGGLIAVEESQESGPVRVWQGSGAAGDWAVTGQLPANAIRAQFDQVLFAFGRDASVQVSVDMGATWRNLDDGDDAEGFDPIVSVSQWAADVVWHDGAWFAVVTTHRYLDALAYAQTRPDDLPPDGLSAEDISCTSIGNGSGASTVSFFANTICEGEPIVSLTIDDEALSEPARRALSGQAPEFSMWRISADPTDQPTSQPADIFAGAPEANLLVIDGAVHSVGTAGEGVWRLGPQRWEQTTIELPGQAVLSGSVDGVQIATHQFRPNVMIDTDEGWVPSTIEVDQLAFADAGAVGINYWWNDKIAPIELVIDDVVIRFEGKVLSVTGPDRLDLSWRTDDEQPDWLQRNEDGRWSITAFGVELAQFTARQWDEAAIAAGYDLSTGRIEVDDANESRPMISSTTDGLTWFALPAQAVLGEPLLPRHIDASSTTVVVVARNQGVGLQSLVDDSEQWWFASFNAEP